MVSYEIWVGEIFMFFLEIGQDFSELACNSLFTPFMDSFSCFHDDCQTVMVLLDMSFSTEVRFKWSLKSSAGSQAAMLGLGGSTYLVWGEASDYMYPILKEKWYQEFD